MLVGSIVFILMVLFDFVAVNLLAMFGGYYSMTDRARSV